MVGSELARRSNYVDLVVCGHTHMPLRGRTVNGIRSLNIGTDYGVFRGIVYDTETGDIRWIGEIFDQPQCWLIDQAE